MKTHVFASLALAAVLVSGAAMAEPTGTNVPGHPRVNEIDQRLENQEKRVDQGVASGSINVKEEARDQAVDGRVAQQLSKDEAKHNGHITKAEQHHMNMELNRNSHRIHHQRHAAVPAATTAH